MSLKRQLEIALDIMTDAQVDEWERIIETLEKQKEVNNGTHDA